MPRPRIFTDEERRVRARASRKAYRERHREADKEYRQANAEKRNAQSRAWYWANAERARARERARANDPSVRTKALARATAWNKANPEKRRLIKARNMRNRKKRDLGFRLECQLRNRLQAVLKGRIKIARTLKLTGCDMAWLIAWLEVQFQPGMTWENYGPVWHIDHKRPCAAFDLENPIEQKLCFHWTNLQPLYAWENLQKQDSTDWQRTA